MKIIFLDVLYDVFFRVFNIIRELHIIYNQNLVNLIVKKQKKKTKIMGRGVKENTSI